MILIITSVACQNDKSMDISEDSPAMLGLASPDEDINIQKSEESSNSHLDIKSNSDSSTHNKMIIKNGEMELEVKDIITTKGIVDNLIKKFNAYYQSEVLTKSDYRFNYSLKIRIPANKFDDFLKEISNINGKITIQSIFSEDVTAEYVDSEIRLGNKMAYLSKYQDLLKQAKSIKEILEVEEQIRGIEEEIEAVKGRMKYLKNQTDLSTLELDLYQINDSGIIESESYITRIWNNLVKGWSVLSEFALILILILPTALIILSIVFILIKLFRKRKKNIQI
jgi:hypothetical protein